MPDNEDLGFSRPKTSNVTRSPRKLPKLPDDAATLPPPLEDEAQGRNSIFENLIEISVLENIFQYLKKIFNNSIELNPRRTTGRPTPPLLR